MRLILVSFLMITNLLWQGGITIKHLMLLELLYISSMMETMEISTDFEFDLEASTLLLQMGMDNSSKVAGLELILFIKMEWEVCSLALTVEIQLTLQQEAKMATSTFTMPQPEQTLLKPF